MLLCQIKTEQKRSTDQSPIKKKQSLEPWFQATYKSLVASWRSMVISNSRGPQSTQGSDKGLNPYGNSSIKDWSEKQRTKYCLPPNCC